MHSKITGYYGSLDRYFAGEMKIRDWLSTQSFEKQLEFGIKQLKEYGGLIASKDGWLFIPFQ